MSRVAVAKCLLLLGISARFTHSQTSGFISFSGNHGVSASTRGWDEVSINPARFGEFVAVVGRGSMAVSVDGAAAVPIDSLPWLGDAVFPGGDAEVTLAGGDVRLTMRSFAPLSPLDALQGFQPVLVGAFSAIATGTAAHTLRFAYAFRCDGRYDTCMGTAAASALPSGGAILQNDHDAPLPFGGAPSPFDRNDAPLPSAWNSSGQIFVGASGETPHTFCDAITAPPAAKWTLVARNSAAMGPDCVFGGWGDGSTLATCEVSCAEDPACTTINFSPASGDCVFRVCQDPAHPNVTADLGYNVYTTVTPKAPRPVLCASASLTATPGAPAAAVASLVWGTYDPAGKYAATFPNARSLFDATVRSVDALAAAHAAFVDALPRSGNASTDESVRWLLAPPVLLTKGVGALTSTMGYVEMCARDSFWTTWLHAYLWPTLEKDMILELTAAQCNVTIPACGGAENDGKIPTTILPFIYRDDNIDITAYYVLRVGRYYEATSDKGLLATVYPSVARALRYLLRRDVGDGVPAANRTSQWSDWLDTSYMVGRKYAPHFCFTFLAALRVGSQAAALLGATGDAAAFKAAYDKGFAFMHAPLVHNAVTKVWSGGMWNVSQRFVQDVWWDGRLTNYTLLDQTVGVFFNVLAPERISGVFAWLSGASGVEGPFGERNLHPYLPHASDPPAVYGNGGAYPWLNFIDATARLTHGAIADGQRIWDKITSTMLYRPASSSPGYVPHMAYEYVHGETGDAMGAFPFGGDGAGFLVASQGFSSWARTDAGVALLGDAPRGANSDSPFCTCNGTAQHHFRLELRSVGAAWAAGVAATSAVAASDLVILRPLTGSAMAAFIRITFSANGSVTGDVVASIATVATQASVAQEPGAPTPVQRHAWVHGVGGGACEPTTWRRGAASVPFALDCPGAHICVAVVW